MTIQPKYFEFIKSGTKRIELRLYDEKRSMINLGDTIEFSDGNGGSFVAKVTGLLRYASFEALFNDYDIGILADKSMTKGELLGVLDEFYDKEKQVQFGVIGIRIELE